MAASTSRQTPTHSRTLFLGSEGVPLRFYVRPGPTKASLFPLIVHGGGVMCRHREWGAVLLTELEETGPPPKGYTTARYVLDCVEKNEQLPLEDYGGQRACPPRAEVRQAQPRAGRTQFSKLDDVAILMYLRSHVKESGRSVRGTVTWQEMERIQLTAHPWQSMRSRYLRYLCGREHLYQLDSRSVIPTAIFPKLNGPEEASAWPAPKPEAAQLWKGKKNPDSRQHIDREEAAASVERVSDGVNSEEECFNIFPVAIREFEVEDDTPELVNIGDELETKKVSQEQQMETDKPLQVNPAKHCPKHKETLAGFVMHNEQSELDSQTPVDELSSLPTASQDEVECAIKAINTLMQTHNLDLCAATQLLLKNSGELSAALHFMETGHRPDGYPIWTHRDDLDLEKADRKVQERLIQKFGSDNLAKRIAFRKS
ncbi:telomeric repeat-binding factor 2-interacting protein 1-like isoform X1 [Mustelus asterias]